ncbi:hypothetical protein EV193_10845 [Herbihabitans rhizosphaerae]|uniref:Uncharacterized protein n=1 Tax=Herbihabitans rhizosphaerae TaxID=1872711 RepID=A0A4V2ES06_9PSEU|nr:DUF6069 family protein [Herbihabitans rhizosphaerae]RZS34697.1 hypothetical protein EV193_10845 [Herbihabitans rhizosphaerae]
MSYQGPANRTAFDYRKLWAGGAATAAVAALVAVVGLLIARGLFDVEVLAPKGGGIWGNANTLTYALIAAAAALGATGLAHLLCVATPTPGQFFGWIMALVTLIAIVLPLTLSVALEAKVATALINLAIGLAITALISGTMASARRPQFPSAPAADATDSWRSRPNYPR